MRMALLVVGVACLVSCATPEVKPVEAKPAVDAAPVVVAKPVVHAPKAPVALTEFFKGARVKASASISFDEKWIAYPTDRGGRYDLWAQPIAGGESVQVTHVKGFLATFAFSPTEDRLVFGMDEGGNEVPHLFFTDSKGKEPVALFPKDPADRRADLVDWCADGKRLAYLSNRRDPAYLDLSLYDVATGASTLLWEASGKLTVERISRDCASWVVTETLSDVDSNVYLGRKGEPKLTLLTPHTGNVSTTTLDFAPNGKELLIGDDASGEFIVVRSIDLKTKKATLQLEAPWDVDAAGFSVGGTLKYVMVNADGALDLTVTEVKSGKPVALAGLKGASYLTSSRSDRYVALSVRNETTPLQVVVLDVKAQTFRSVEPAIPLSLAKFEFVSARSVRVKSFDGKEVPAFVYQPAGEGPFPLIIDVHGGPTAQARRQFAGFHQYLVSKGYVVMVPNVRGSTGYGKSWMKADNKDLGGGPLKDVIALKQWAVENVKVDGARAVIMGGSYGGYMTLAAATFAPTEFAAHVDFFGVSDLASVVRDFPPEWRPYAQYIFQKFGDPDDAADQKYQHDRSPLFFVDRIVRPLLVVQGTNDARVKKDQSDRLVEGLRKRNIPVDYLVIEGEGHGFSKTENFEKAVTVMDRFLDKHVFGDTEVVVLP